MPGKPPEAPSRSSFAPRARSELKPFRENLLTVPRLFGYYGGNTPEVLYP
jgi:hypothetical protein